MFMSKLRYRLAVDAALSPGATIALHDKAAHYLASVLRLGVGDSVALFNRSDGEWRARISAIRRKEITLVPEELLRPPAVRGKFHLTVCFAPIKGGRLETIIEKATELGANVMQPVITSRTVVDKVNLERAAAIAREAAGQCGRIEWPEINPPLKLLTMLDDWPSDVALIYGDESGRSGSVLMLTRPSLETPGSVLGEDIHRWAVLTGPEGGFTPEEFSALKRTASATGVGLGPRILRADTAIITLCVATLMAWGDWENTPGFQS